MRNKMQPAPLPSAEIVRNTFEYDPITGDLHWKPRTVRPESKKSDRIFNTLFAGKKTGCDNGCGYLRVLWNKRHYVAHRICWLHYYGNIPALEIDHINGDRSDNRIANLRLATTSDNSANQKMRSDCSSGFKGVRRRPNNRFEASIRKNGKKTHLGDFCSAEEAHAAYCEAAKKTHGRFFRSA